MFLVPIWWLEANLGPIITPCQYWTQNTTEGHRAKYKSARLIHAQWFMWPQTVPKPGTVVHVANMVTKVLWPSPHSTQLSIMEITQKGSIIQHQVPNIIRTCHKVRKEGEESRPNPMEIMKFPPKEPYPSLISNLSPGWRQQWPNIDYYKLYNNTNTNLHTNIYLHTSRREAMIHDSRSIRLYRNLA